MTFKEKLDKGENPSFEDAWDEWFKARLKGELRYVYVYLGFTFDEYVKYIQGRLVTNLESNGGGI